MAGPSDVAAWDRIRALLTATPADLTALTLAVVDLTEDERRAVAPELRSFVPARKYDPTHPVHEAAVALVGAGVLPDAKSVAAWLNRWWMRHVNVLRDAFGYPQYVETSVVPNVFYVLIERV